MAKAGVEVKKETKAQNQRRLYKEYPGLASFVPAKKRRRVIAQAKRDDKAGSDD